MKISTKKTEGIQSRKRKPLIRRKTSTQKKASQKIAQNRRSLRKLASYSIVAGKLAGLLFITVLVVWMGMRAYNSKIFHVRDVIVYDCQELAPQEVKEIVLANIPDNILDIQLDQLKIRLEQIRWIRNVEIRRVLPSTLLIHVYERVPSVILEMGGQLMVSDDEGVLLDRHGPRYGKLDVPVFKGIVGEDIDGYTSYQQVNSERIRHAMNMLEQIGSVAPQYLQRISEVDISDQDNLKIMLVDDTMEIYIGNKDYAQRLQGFFTDSRYQELRKTKGNITAVDLRLGHSIILKFDRATTVSSSKEMH
ncbi:MAG: FtsQ-type POTRA domain-containing protein [Acidobacteriota bacterium]|jgi:cell division septal protein FtsQ